MAGAGGSGGGHSGADARREGGRLRLEGEGGHRGRVRPALRTGAPGGRRVSRQCACALSCFQWLISVPSACREFLLWLVGRGSGAGVRREAGTAGWTAVGGLGCHRISGAWWPHGASVIGCYNQCDLVAHCREMAGEEERGADGGVARLRPTHLPHSPLTDHSTLVLCIFDVIAVGSADHPRTLSNAKPHSPARTPLPWLL